MRIVIALGGNMISDASNKAESFQDQKKRIAVSAKIIVDIIELGHEVILTHGNGPQVGSLLLQQLADVQGSVPLPLNILGALTQGQIGVLLQHELYNEFSKREIIKPVVVIPTTVIVDGDDPGFSDPTKPVGPFFDKCVLDKFLENDPEFDYTETEKGYRRLVPSPQPKQILESSLIDELSTNHLVIAVGGGGTPTVEVDRQLMMKDAVIDKDLASSLLAETIGADLLMILTNVDGVYRNFNKPDQEFLDTVSHKEAEDLLVSEQVSKGSMAPKIQAGINFTKGETIITSPENAIASLKQQAGTRITK